MACHRQGRVDPGGLRQAEHPLLETVGGPEQLGTEDGRGPAGDGLPMRKGCPLNPEPPDGPHIGSGLSGAGWALGGITAATRGVSAELLMSVVPLRKRWQIGLSYYSGRNIDFHLAIAATAMVPVDSPLAVGVLKWLSV
ncbi:hypothetical protein NDU88_004366 [Pleurodeles waltl]|uniref:Uncharacterized protein n=1 Tax=Pleurodeles waltl TaxID=8319 RepID=A0AAV7M7P1_PLEWA|nr:hypothetical protein NDU88_004366 [Pleurodeles waltl]